MLEVKDISISIETGRGNLSAVSGVSFDIRSGEWFGLVGESGSGKSLTALSIISLLSEQVRRTSGNINFNGVDLGSLNNKQLRAMRGSEIGMVFQEPMTSLNPVFTIGDQLSEVFQIHKGFSRKKSYIESKRMLDAVRIPDASSCLSKYPSELSGGMRQRVMIAMALSCRPKLLIADEPTTALDVTIQAQILKLMKELSREFDTATLLITHDLAVVSETCDQVGVLYGGKLLEVGLVDEVFEKPSHPYTRGLLSSVPDLTSDLRKLTPIPGTVPKLGGFPKGCLFSDRCNRADSECGTVPVESLSESGKRFSCHHPIA